MQLKEIRIIGDGEKSKITIEATLEEWVRFYGMTMDDFMVECEGSPFRLIKGMNKKVKGVSNDKRDDRSEHGPDEGNKGSVPF